MITYDKVCEVAANYANDLREFRLDGDLNRLMGFLEAVMSAGAQFSAEDFYNALTENEHKAFLAIREEIGLVGNISVVKLIQKTSISRPVWTSLLQKMEKHGVALVKGQGAKGTYIEMRKEIEDDGIGATE